MEPFSADFFSSLAGKLAGNVPDDPDDETILACTVDGEADVILSGDRHLLGLGSFRGIPVLTIRAYLDRLNESEEVGQ